MRLFVFITAICSLSVWHLAETAFAQDEAKDLDKMQGEWKLDLAYDQGEEAPAEVLGKIFKIKGDQLFPASDPKDSLTVKLDASKKPGHINMMDKTLTNLGIYEISKDKLTLYFTEGGERPKIFPASKEKSKEDKAIYLVLSRKN
jgi:uncharacterized protein (TIGR03067 family)